MVFYARPDEFHLSFCEVRNISKQNNLMLSLLVVLYNKIQTMGRRYFKRNWEIPFWKMRIRRLLFPNSFNPLALLKFFWACHVVWPCIKYYFNYLQVCILVLRVVSLQILNLPSRTSGQVLYFCLLSLYTSLFWFENINFNNFISFVYRFSRLLKVAYTISTPQAKFKWNLSHEMLRWKVGLSLQAFI